MLRDKVDRAGEMAVFVAVAEAGSLSGAARRLGLTPSAVSRIVARTEARLGARLLVRTTRTLRLTAEGRPTGAPRAASWRISTRPKPRSPTGAARAGGSGSAPPPPMAGS